MNRASFRCCVGTQSVCPEKNGHYRKEQHIQFILFLLACWADVFVSSQDLMRQAGEVTYADAHKGRANEGVIEFRSRSDMKRALEKLDGTDINGRKIRLVEDKPRRRRSYSGSRSR